MGCDLDTQGSSIRSSILSTEPQMRHVLQDLTISGRWAVTTLSVLLTIVDAGKACALFYRTLLSRGRIYLIFNFFFLIFIFLRCTVTRVEIIPVVLIIYWTPFTFSYTRCPENVFILKHKSALFHNHITEVCNHTIRSNNKNKLNFQNYSIHENKKNKTKKTCCSTVNCQYPHTYNNTQAQTQMQGHEKRKADMDMPLLSERHLTSSISWKVLRKHSRMVFSSDHSEARSVKTRAIAQAISQVS